MEHSTEKLLDFLSPHFGEILFHHFTGDELIKQKSLQNYNYLLSRNILDFRGKNANFLEISPSKNFVSHKISETIDATGYLLDISKSALEKGKEIAKNEGIKSRLVYKVGDFRRLPFHENFFDFVFVSAAIHHSYSPIQVMREATRVTKLGGKIFILNEPVERLASTYSYNGTRQGGGGVSEAFEKKIDELGITGFLSYPVVGGRSESLFGMTENHNILLRMYENLLPQHLTTEQLDFSPADCSDFELDFLNSLQGEFFEAWKLFEGKMDQLKSNLTKNDLNRMKGFGFSLPSKDALKAIVLRSYLNYQQDYPNGHHNDDLRAKIMIFGGSVSGVYSKKKRCPKIEEPEEIPKLVGSTFYGYGHSIDIKNNKFPDIQREALNEELFTGVERVLDGSNVSYINKERVIRISPPLLNVTSVFGLRAFSVHQGHDYSIQCSNGSQLLFQQNIIRSESWSKVIILENVESSIQLSIEGPDGLALEGFLRIGSVILMPLEKMT